MKKFLSASLLVVLTVVGTIAVSVSLAGKPVEAKPLDVTRANGLRKFAVVRMSPEGRPAFLAWLVSDEGEAYIIPDAYHDAFDRMKEGEVVELPPSWPMWHQPITFFCSPEQNRSFWLEHLRSSASRANPDQGPDDHGFDANTMVFARQ